VALALLLVTAGLLVWRLAGGTDEELLAPGGPPPAGVLETVELLNGDSEAQRRALDPDLAAGLAEQSVEDPVVPPGSTVELDGDGWRSEIEGFGVASGRLVSEDGEATAVEIAFTEDGGTWFVTAAAEVG
jgi:hypothetical protein